MSFHRENFNFVYTAVKTHFLEKLKICFHSGGGTGVFFFLRNYRWTARGKMKWRRSASSVRQERHLDILLSCTSTRDTRGNVINGTETSESVQLGIP
jgi:hypothetical protein